MYVDSFIDNITCPMLSGSVKQSRRSYAFTRAQAMFHLIKALYRASRAVP